MNHQRLTNIPLRLVNIYMGLNQESFVNSDSFSHRFEYRGIVGTR